MSDASYARLRGPTARLAGALIVAAALHAFAPRPARAQNEAAVAKNLTANIERAERELAKRQNAIGAERAKLAKQLDEAQAAVEDLRAKTVAARRLADEQTLGLDKLEARVAALRNQSQFQSRLLTDFADRTKPAIPGAPARADDLLGNLSALKAYLARATEDLDPRWQDLELAMPDGRVEGVRSLALGPVQWFFEPSADRGGLVGREGGIAKAALVFAAAAQTDGLRSLYRSGRGAVTLDPTLSEALLIAEDHDTLVEHLRKGGIWVIPILLFALFATCTAVVKGVSLWRLPAIVPALATQAEKLMREAGGDLAPLRNGLVGAQAELFDISLAARNLQQRDERLFACLLAHKHRLERWLGAIAVTASVSPLLGLLGTVSGMITTFKLLKLFGAGDPSSVSVGISQALITTELGLIVAIPALLAHAIMTRRVGAYFSALETSAIELSQLPLREQAA